VSRTDTNSCPLYTASEKNNFECVALLLAAPGIEVNRLNSDGTSALSVGSQKNSEEAVKLLLAHPDLDPNTEHVRQHATALYLTCKLGHLNIVQLLIADPRTDIDKARPSSGSPLFVAVRNHRTAIAVALIAKGADINKKDKEGVSILKAAVEAHDAESVAVLVMRGASTEGVYNELETACLRGDAQAARALARGGGTSEKLPGLHVAILNGDQDGVAASCGLEGRQSNASDTDGMGMPSLYYAIELGMSGGLAPVLGPGLSASPEFMKCIQAAIGAHDVDSSAYKIGARYQSFTLNLVESGLTETLSGCKSTVTGYVGTVAAGLFFEANGAAFATLKAASLLRLDMIAKPLEELYAKEDLAAILGGIGLEYDGKVVRNDDKGLMPMPPWFLRATKPSMISYVK